MLFFENDYSTATHPQILEVLSKLNENKLLGYGNDRYCKSAKEKIKKICSKEDIDIYFLVGGTQTNSIIISSLLDSYEGVIAVDTGHISTHEAGAIEYTGHKVMTLKQHEGKMCAKELREYLETFYSDDLKTHMVFPKMVYISHPTEYGTLYTNEELKELSQICKEFELYFMIDGARLGYGVMAKDTDVKISDIAKYSDVFYIGGTKLGALCGEAVVFSKDIVPNHFTTIIKSHGALLAKGYILGAQFDAFFTNDLYFKLGKHAIDMAEILKNAIRDKGYDFYFDSPTNLQFIIMKNEKVKELEKKVVFSFKEKYDENHTVIRLVTDWATKEEDVYKLIDLL
ncbi:MAG: aminotransferase class I/II-fold pyridoxal phosphate-dependent enzyme [Peptoniphilaceae bacterium]|uniref:threonine aldolase family protein n=1 Tax=Parvimonas sp. TaxID=1944660 RepID=UPI0025D5FC76|nr:aminotransferase class I/II-fold pyridoxal phosphate-dependent enzyme [Parvimonas sp.]MCI5997877.1 aminotransferase class I/II-fold pyridoxal phosphate-dependent enzyme [Parvimonas sp.]MDD7765129.1 aminotransferase class I/II-fold pyridoxal phosphate-dependent enzyme [Peptoniphilaceae bacterium]MDY3051499.1 aminotransferase class I/II-fold pyridoxal phosphate-dependent enzyme [Parvimonas sp.]